jgi:hypothetical protein
MADENIYIEGIKEALTSMGNGITQGFTKLAEVVSSAPSNTAKIVVIVILLIIELVFAKFVQIANKPIKWIIIILLAIIAVSIIFSFF